MLNRLWVTLLLGCVIAVNTGVAFAALTSEEKTVFKNSFLSECRSQCPSEMKKALEDSLPNHTPEQLKSFTDKCLETCQCDLDNMTNYVSDKMLEEAVNSQKAKADDNAPAMKAFLQKIEVLSQDCANQAFYGTPMP